ncbi:MAG: thermonuclease family protein [Candidatus Rokubacteria bacterium]|nr:thermonuclease family protein [Candidatus Rokubacteria bacterium]
MRAIVATLLLAAATAVAEPQRRVTIWHPHVVSPAVVRVWDGDTFDAGDERVRLRGVDAPERGSPGADAAARRLRELLRQGPVTIVPRAEDAYGRTVADVYVAGVNVAAVLAAEGLATVRTRRGRND